MGNLGYGHTLRQFIPRRVEQGLGNFCIVQVVVAALRLVVGVYVEPCPLCDGTELRVVRPDAGPSAELSFMITVLQSGAAGACCPAATQGRLP